MSLLPKEKTPAKKDPLSATTLIYGHPKVGKSTFCSNFPNTLFLATERGLDYLNVYQVPITTYEELCEAYKELKVGNHEFKTLVIDTVDRLYQIIRDYVMKKNNIQHESELEWGKGWELVAKTFSTVFYNLTNLPMGIVIISHAEQKEEKTRTGKEVKIYPTLPKKARDLIVNFVDNILYFEALDTVDEEGNPTIKRIIRTKPSQAYEAGSRIGGLPDDIPLDYEEYMKAIKGALK